ncbi:MAG: hypothetical protein ACYCVC_01555 [Acidimicrobiales bacterium]
MPWPWRRRRWAGVAVAGALLVLVLAEPVPASGVGEPSARPNPADFSCVLRPLPHGVARSAPGAERLSGPAVTALTGGAARHGFALDGGDLVVAPPPPGSRPVLTAHQALCGAMASTGGLSSTAAQGVAVGYGEVSVARTFFPALTSLPYPGVVVAQNPTVASFHDRLAWMVVVHANPPSFNCPEERRPVRLVPRPGDHGYEVFLVDARTGADALVYWEGGPGGCTTGARVPPHVAVAEESVSVPWTLVARNPDGYSGTISATVLPCEKAPSTVWVDQSGPQVGVQVTRPFGPTCGPPEKTLIGLRAAVVTADLPAVIGHDPVGLLTGLAPPGPAPPGPTSTTTTTSPSLVPVGASSNGQTVVLRVGQVVTVQPLPGAQGLTSVGVPVSSDPAVLGPLTPGPQPIVAELRAWKPGTAEITVPESDCVHPGSDQVPCDGPFVVHVVVR